ncbi:ceramidase domain-containing protein [Breoghania sp.]|uniref:ceramidase domain-containing protein n=1 Tax=Breoghania sp. TaxID=2065378 RepID=UPI0029CA8C54|nr:ceramidase domain-containing protein [Breoghania sp.]
MDPTQLVVAYCERLDGAFWAEPANAISNMTFFMTTVGILWALFRKRRFDVPVIGLSALVALIGVSSFLFHTLATPLTSALDILSVAIFILVVFFFAILRLFKIGLTGATLVTVGFLGLSWFLSLLLGPKLGLSAMYIGPLISLFAIALTIAPNNRKIALGFFMTGLMFTLSVIFLTMDQQFCDWFPIGTHFMWHVLNAVVAYMLLRLVIYAKQVNQPAPNHPA